MVVHHPRPRTGGNDESIKPRPTANEPPGTGSRPTRLRAKARAAEKKATAPRANPTSNDEISENSGLIATVKYG